MHSDIDSARRIVQEQDPRLFHQPFPDDHLLLVTARERANRRIEVIHLDSQPAHRFIDGSSFLPRIDHPVVA